MLRAFSLVKSFKNPTFKELCRENRYNITIQGRLKYSNESSEKKETISKKSQNEKQCKPGKLKKKLIDLSSITAAVIGGDSGIGYATACELLNQSVKAVGIFGSNFCKGKEACRTLNARFGDRKAVFYSVDVNKEDDIVCAICKMTKEFGVIGAFVNAFGECNGKNWEKELTLNLIGMSRCTILANQYFISKKTPGVIVNTAGIFGKLPLAGCPTTCAAQHGIVGLSKSFGREELFSATKVRVVVICPGITDNDMFRKAEKRALTPYMGAVLKTEIEKMKKQRPEVCGMGVVHVMNFADSGSVWFIEGNELYRMDSTNPYDHSQLYVQYPG